MKHHRDRILVLGRIDYGEKDRVLTVLGQDLGKISIMAKSTRSSKSRLAGSIELFCEIDADLVAGRGEIFTLAGARIHQNYTNISSDLDKTMLAYDILNHVNKTVYGPAAREYYFLLAASLQSLNGKEGDPLLVKGWFLTQLLALSGHLPNLNTDAAGQPLKLASRYDYDYDKQSFLASPGGKYHPEDIKLIRLYCDRSRPLKVNAPEKYLKSSTQLVEDLVRLQLY